MLNVSMSVPDVEFSWSRTTNAKRKADYSVFNLLTNKWKKKRKKNHSDIHLHSNDNRSDDELCAAMVLFLKLFFKLFEHSIICLVIDEGKNYRDCICEIKQYDMSSSTNDIWPEAVVSSILIDCKLFMNGTQNVFSKFSNYSINILFLSRALTHTHTRVKWSSLSRMCVFPCRFSLCVSV